MNRRLLHLIVATSLCCNLAPASPPSRDTGLQRWSAHLTRDVLPWWTTTPPAEQTPTLRLRALYVHAVSLARETNPTIKTTLRAQFDSRCAALIPQLEKTPANSTAVQAWIIILLADIHALAGKPEALRLARQLFTQLDPLAHDTEHGGYFLTYSTSNDTLRDHESSRKHAPTQLHLLLALTRLLQATPQDPLIRARLAELHALIPRFVSTETGHVRWALARDWRPAEFARPINNQTLYGQNAETITYLLAANTALGLPSADILPLLQTIARALIRDGISPDGAVYYLGPMAGPAIDRRVWWWPQVETAAALWQMYQLTGDNRYRATFDNVSTWAFTHLVPQPPAPPGRWHTVCAPDGHPLPHTNAPHEIQTGYHVTRSILTMESFPPSAMRHPPATPATSPQNPPVAARTLPTPAP